jgi:formamidopyrimidine-DNA glycosylase
VVQRRDDLRFPLPPRFAERLTGRRVETIGRRAQYILVHLYQGEVLLCHLGMSGRMTLVDRPEQPLARHDHIVFTTEDGWDLRFNDARRFGAMDLIDAARLDQHWLLKDLGPEPLGNSFNGPFLAEKLAGKRTAIKAALLDQKVVAGLGNIYVCEALFDAGLSPRRLAYTVKSRRAERLVAAIRQVLGRAIEAGGSSLRDYVKADGELGYFQHHWAVYGREGAPCPDCHCDLEHTGGVRRIVQSNRSTFFCPTRQR